MDQDHQVAARATQKKQVEYGNSEFYQDLIKARALSLKGKSAYGYYADAYFTTVTNVLESLPEGYKTPEGFDPKNNNVRMQVFMRHPGGCLVAGVDLALAIISNGMTEQGLKNVKVSAIDDGTWVPYSGMANDVTPVIDIIGPYRYFTELETTYLGLLARCTRVANNVLECLEASNGTPVLFFPERFDSYSVQEMDGYAYWMAVKFYNKEHGTNLPVIVSSPASAGLFGSNGKNQGSTPHALIASFKKNEVEAMLMFGQYTDPNIKRIFLADFNNDVKGSTLIVAKEYWQRWLAAWKRDGWWNNEDLKRWRLWGIRIDTGATLIDKTMQELDQREGGVSPMLVLTMRNFLDNELPEILKDETTDTETYQILIEWCKSLSITVTGGFGPSKIQRFESGASISKSRIPVNAYGVGSGMLKNDTSFDFTADLAEMEFKGRWPYWTPISKVGRAPNYNPNVRIVNFDDYLV